MASTPIFHASVAGISGLAFPLGSILYFTPTDDQAVYRIADQTALTVTAQVEPAMARFLAAVVLEPRLLALTGRVVA